MNAILFGQLTIVLKILARHHYHSHGYNRRTADSPLSKPPELLQISKWLDNVGASADDVVLSVGDIVASIPKFPGQQRGQVDKGSLRCNAIPRLHWSTSVIPPSGEQVPCQ
jgi:hypothetical protein